MTERDNIRLIPPTRESLQKIDTLVAHLIKNGETYITKHKAFELYKLTIDSNSPPVPTGDDPCYLDVSLTSFDGSRTKFSIEQSHVNKELVTPPSDLEINDDDLFASQLDEWQWELSTLDDAEMEELAQKIQDAAGILHFTPSESAFDTLRKTIDFVMQNAKAEKMTRVDFTAVVEGTEYKTHLFVSEVTDEPLDDETPRIEVQWREKEGTTMKRERSLKIYPIYADEDPEFSAALIEREVDDIGTEELIEEWETTKKTPQTIKKPLGSRKAIEDDAQTVIKLLEAATQ